MLGDAWESLRMLAIPHCPIAPTNSTNHTACAPDLWPLDPDHPAGAQGDRHCPSQDLGAKDDELHQHGDIVQGPRGQAQL